MPRWTLVALMIGACSFDPSTRIEGGDLGPDAANPTASTSGDAAGQVNPDASTSPAPDAKPIEPVSLTCEDIYGNATNFDLCEATSDSCRFYVVTNEDTCTNLCQSFGGACIDNYDGNCGTNIGSQGCNIVHNDQVCICTLPSASP